MSEILSHPIPAVIILLGVLVFVHELGHYAVGKWCGIAVEIFSIGFGPKIVGFRRNGTDYRLSWIPLGGFVKFAGAHPSEEVPENLKGIGFLQASLPKRAATVMAGPLANFFLAILVYAILGMAGIPHPAASIGYVVQNSPAERAGFQYGDHVVSIDGKPIENWRDLEELISDSPEKEIDVVVRRDGLPVTIQLTPEAVDATDILGRKMTIGRAGIALGRIPANVAITDRDAQAAKAGLKPGDRITKLEYLDQAFDLDYFPELTAGLHRALMMGAEQVKLHVADNERQPSTVEISLAPFSGAKTTPSSLAHGLGLIDTQLTVLEVKDPVISNLQPGDRIVRWEGIPLRDVFHLREKLLENKSPKVRVAFLRDFELRTEQITLKGVDAQRPEGKVTVYTLPLLFLGQPQEPPPVYERYDNPISALGYGIRETLVQTGGLAVAVGSLITGEIPLKALGGPMLIAKVAGDSARRGWQTFFGSLALISVNLGLLNLLPIPALDGGQMVLIGAEAIRRRPLREAAIENFQKIGFAMIMALIVLATYNDLSRFWKSMLESVTGIFQ